MTQTLSVISGSVVAPQGFLVSSYPAGIRHAGRDDLMLVVSEGEAAAAGVLTTNRVHAWCVAHNRTRLKGGRAWAMVCNAGNANACNGERGQESDREMAELVSGIIGSRFGVSGGTVLTASTGVIGREFPIEAVRAAATGLGAALGRSEADGERAARAIMTTDLVPKGVAVQFEVEGRPVRIGGIAKGSGMIAPNMATMLGFLTTDAEVAPELLQEVLMRAVDRSFNRITVDGDTSTNDMALMLANGKSGVKIEVKNGEGSEALKQFEAGVRFVCEALAKKIARDGEGATKLVTVRLKNPPEGGDRIAKTIAESPLVKTACFGNDPNWGRIMAAAGRAGVDFDPANVVVRLAGHEVFRNAEPTTFVPAEVSASMKREELEIELEFLGMQSGAEQREEIVYWTCDLSYDYVRINADYST